MIFYLGNKVEVVDEKIRLNRNELKAWKYGYNKEFDIIIISKDGTLGSIFYMQGIKIGLPEPPSEREDIFNWNKTASNQRWKRAKLPAGLNENTMYNSEFEEYIMEEIRRRKYGFWLNIKGELVYMPGPSYFFYQWNELDDGYPTFRIIQNELLIYWEACKADERCYGINYVKNRRFGWSTLCNNEQLESGTSNKNRKLGIISKTGEDAKEMFDLLVFTFMRLPPFFKPAWDGTTTPKKVLNLTEQNRKKKLSADEDDGIDESLNTYIRYYSTALNSMDGGKKVFRSSVDEGAKFPKDVPFNKYWGIIKTSHRQGKRIVGKSMVGSTVNALKKGGAEYKIVWDGSDPLERNENGQTASGLYRLFISAEFGLEGSYDTYGFCIVEDPKKPVLTDEGIYTEIGSKRYLENELKALEDDPEAWNEQLRQFPRNPKEAFRDEATECEFNLVKLMEQIEHNTFEHGHDQNGSSEIERGNFRWKNGVQDTEVIWTPDPVKGRFWIKKGCHPPIEYRNKKPLKTINGVTAFAPTAGHIGAFGADPYNRDKSADGRGSLGAIHLSTRMNTSELPNDEFILEYIDRPSKVEFFFEDMIMVMVYYSMPVLGELSNEAFLTKLLDRGYRHFSLNNPFKPWKELSPTEKKLGGAPPQGTKIADQQFYAIEAYVEDKVGVSRDDSDRPKGQMGSMVFNRTLDQIKDVDLKDRTKYDAFISASLSRLANQKRVLKQKKTVTRRNPFTKYSNNSGKSIRV